MNSGGMNYALKMLQYMRTGARVNSRVNVTVEWTEGGKEHQAEGYTVDISPKGLSSDCASGVRPRPETEAQEWQQPQGVRGDFDLART